MAVLLAILKFIGILLLVILGLVLLICLAVLFVPIRYVVECRSRKEIRIGFRVSWLLRLLQIKRGMYETRINIFLLGINIKRWRSLWRKVCGLFRRGGEVEETLEEEQSPVVSDVDLVDDFQAHTSDTDADAEEWGESKDKVDIETDYEDQQAKDSEEDAKARTRKRKKTFSFDVISSIIAFIRDNENKIGIKKIKKEAMALIKYTVPRYIRGEIVFGTGDPCTTGWLLGVISMFPVAYTEGLTVCPKFEDKCFRADGVIRGRIRVIYLVRMLLRGYLDDDIKRVVVKIKKLTGK